MSLVTICVPAYNRPQDLRRTVSALLNQTFQDIRVVVFDDCSTLDLSTALNDFRDSRLEYRRNERNLRLYGNWNHAIAATDSKYIAIYHDHDLYGSHIVERSVALLETHNDIAFVHTGLNMIDENERITMRDVREFPQVMPGKEMRCLLANSWSSPVMAATVMARRSVYERTGNYAFERYGLSCDGDMWFQMSKYGDVGYVREPMAQIRMRTRSDATAKMDWSNYLKGIQMHMDHVSEYYAGTPEVGIRHSRIKLRALREILLLQYRAQLLEPRDIVSEGEQVILDRFGPFFGRGVNSVLSSELLKLLSKRYVLRWYYGIQAIKQRRKYASISKDTNSSVEMEVMADSKGTREKRP